MCHGCCAMCDVFVPLTLDVGFVVCDAYICVCVMLDARCVKLFV